MLAIKGTCRVCRGALSIIEPGLVCFECEKYHHGKCIVPPTGPERLGKLVVSKEPWFCKACKGKPSLKKDVIRSEEEVVKVKKKFDTVMDLRFLLVMIEEALGNINRKCQELSDDADDLRKKNEYMRKKIKLHEQYGHRLPQNFREWRSRRRELGIHERDEKTTKFHDHYGNEAYFEKKKQLERYLRKLQYKPKIEEEREKKKKEKKTKGTEDSTLVAQRIFARTSYPRAYLLQFALTIAIVAYTLLGAMIFSLIEGSYEVELINEISKKRAETMSDFSEKSLADYYDFLIEKFKINPRLLMRPDRDWDFLGSAYFCGTTYTTIGYGEIYPVTDFGKILMIIYAFFGIPLFVALLTSYGQSLLQFLRFFYNLICCRCTWGCCSIRKSTTDPAEEVKVPLYYFYFFMILILLLGAVIYHFGENWTYWESLYFVFLTLSTIGFGDLVPENRYYMMITVVYVIVGLSMTSLIISTIIERLDNKIQVASKKLGDKIDSYIDDNY